MEILTRISELHNFGNKFQFCQTNLLILPNLIPQKNFFMYICHNQEYPHAAPCEKDGSLKAENIIPFIKKETRAVVMLHASNVCGTAMPIEAFMQYAATKQ